MQFYEKLPLQSRACAGFFIGEKTEGPIPPHQLGTGERCELLSGVQGEPRSPKCFPLFSPLGMASPDTITSPSPSVDYHADIGGKTPVPHPHMPLTPVYNLWENGLQVPQTILNWTDATAPMSYGIKYRQCQWTLYNREGYINQTIGQFIIRSSTPAGRETMQ